MKRRITALIIALCMVLMMMPMHAHATETEHIHSWHSSWSVDEESHWHICVSGSGCTEKGEYAAHNWDEYYQISCYTCFYSKPHTHTGGTATCTSRATCKLCGLLYGDTDPNSHKKSFYTSIDADAHKITCDCGTLVIEREEHAFVDWSDVPYCFMCGYEDQTPAHTHNWEWAYDRFGHWEKCFGCGESSTAAEDHLFDGNSDATCNKCGYTRFFTITTESMANATAGEAYSQSFSYSGNASGEVVWNATGLPNGLTINSSTGVVSGTPAMGGSYKVTISMEATGGGSASKDFNLTVAYGLAITTESMANATVGEAYSQSFSYSGNASGVVFWNATGLPNGLTINGGTGVVSGTPTMGGTYKVTISMGATGGGSASKDFNLTVGYGLAITTESMANATAGEAYSQSFSYSGSASGVVFWNAEGLPKGLSINSGTGVVSGTPTETGTYKVTIIMGATGGGSVSKEFNLTVTLPEGHEHSYSAATCTEPATCSCGMKIGDVDMNNHVGGTEIRGAMPADEFTEGYTGNTYCKGCKSLLSRGTTIPSTHKHSYSYDYGRDVHWKVCSSCQTITGREEHDWYIYNKDVARHYWRCDCGNQGWSNEHFDDNDTGLCDDCGHEMPHKHSWGEWTPSGDDIGKHIRICSTDSRHTETDICQDGIGEGEFCDVCGRDLHMHRYAWKYDTAVHWEECRCGDKKETVEHSFHTDSSHEFNYDETEHWYECVCGAKEAAAKHTWSLSGEHSFKCSDCDMEWSEGHLFERYLPSEYNPDKYHVKYCLGCDTMSPDVEPGKHIFELQFDQDGHWEECTDCRYAKEIITAHSLNEIVPSEGRDHYHDVYCAECDYIEKQDCTFNTYVGNEAGHWLICDLCAKAHPDGVVGDHVDEDINETCDICGESMKHTEHIYEWISTSGMYHKGTCACGSAIYGAHTDDDNDGKCDTCKTDVMGATQGKFGQISYIEYSPANENTNSGDISAEDYNMTDCDADQIFSGASRNGDAVYFIEDTMLGDAIFNAGTGYNYSPLYSQNIHIDGANGVVTLTARGASSYDENTKYLSVHILGDGTMQYAAAVRDGDSVKSKIHITETSPFIILAINEQPDMVITRSAFIQVLWTMEGSPETEYQAQFADIEQDAAYAMSVNWAAENGLLTIFDGETFEPDTALTREQLAAILHGYAIYRNADVSVGEDTNILSFEDAFEISEAAIPAVQWMCGAGLMQDEDGYILPHVELLCSEAWEMVSALSAMLPQNDVM